MAKITQAERVRRALERSAARARRAAAEPAPAPSRCFTAIDPAGQMRVALTRLSREGVQQAIAGHVASRIGVNREDWPRARRDGWRVVPVRLQQVSR